MSTIWTPEDTQAGDAAGPRQPSSMSVESNGTTEASRGSESQVAAPAKVVHSTGAPDTGVRNMSKSQSQQINPKQSDRVGTADSGRRVKKSHIPRTLTFTDADYLVAPVVVRNESNLFLSLLIFAACIAGFVGIWMVLNDASTAMLARVGERIATAVSSHMDFIVHSYLDFPIYVGGLLQALQREGELDVSQINGTSLELNRLFLDFVVMFDIAAVYIGLNDGAMIYAKKSDASTFLLGARMPGMNQTYFKYNVTNTISAEYVGDPVFRDTSYDPRERVWFQHANASQGPGWTPIYTYATDQLGITFYQPLYDNVTMIGVIGIDMTLDALRMKMTDILSFEGGSGFIFDLNQTAASPVLGSGDLMADSFAVVQAIHGDSTAAQSATVITNEIIVSYAPMSYLQNIKWTLVFAIPQSVFMESVDQLNAVSFFLAVLSLIGLSAALAFLSRVAPKVAQARIYCAQIVEKYRKDDGRVEFGPGRVGPPPEQHPGRESLRQMSFQLDADPNVDGYSMTRQNCLNCEYAVRKCGLVNSDMRLMGFLGAGMALIFGCMAIMWMSWTFRYSERTEFYYDKLISHISQNAYTETLGFMSFPGLALEFMARKYARGTLSLSYVDNATNAKYDRFLYDMMQTFQKPGLKNNWLIDMIYFADQNGRMQGVEVWENTSQPAASWTLRTAARDPTTNPPFTLNGQPFIPPCYVKYHINAEGTRDINQTNSLFTQNCNYEPRIRAWYTGAAERSSPGWTFPYTFVSGDLGVTAFWPLFNPNNATDLVGVLAADARLSKVSKALQAIVDDFTTIFVTTTPDAGKASAGWMVASSVLGEKQTESVDGALIRLEALRAPDPLERAAAQYLMLESYKGGIVLDSIPSSGIVRLDRLLTDPFTAAAYISDDKGMKFLSVTLVEKDVYVDELSRYNSFTILFSFGVILLAYIFLSHGYQSLREIVEFQTTEEAPTAEDALGLPEPPIEDLAHVVKLIGPLVKAAETKPTLKQVREWEDRDPERLASETTRMIEQAVSLLNCAAQGQNVLMICELKLQGKFWMLRILDHFLYRVGFQIILLIHQFLSFWEPPTPEDMKNYGVETWVLALEGAILLVEISNCTMRCLINHRYLPNSEAGKASARINKVLNSSVIPLADVIYVIVLFLTCLDWCLTIGGRVSFEYYFPMRPFLLLACNAASFEVLRSFVTVLYNARQIFVLLWSLCMISAVLSFTFFRGLVNVEQVEDNFGTFFSSLLVMTAFITTTDNYPDLVADSTRVGTFGMILYWIVWIFIGTFFMIAMFLSIFQTRFALAREKKLAESVVHSRFALCAAFILFNMDDSAKVDLDEFGKFAAFLQTEGSQPGLFVHVLNFFFCASTKDSEVVHGVKSNQSDLDKLIQAERAPNVKNQPEFVTRAATLNSIEMESFTETKRESETAQEMNDFFDKLNADGGGTLDIKGFILELEDLLELMKRKSINKKIWGYLWRDILESRRTSTLRLSLVAIQFWMISFYGLVKSDATIDYLLTVLLWAYVFEVLLSVWVYGPSEYWHYAKFHADVHFMGFFFRMELIVMLISFIIWLGLTITAQSLEDPPPIFSFESELTRTYRVAFAIPALRLLGIIPGTRQLVNALLSMVPRFLPILYLLLVLFFFYAIIGVTLMRGKFDVLGDELNGTTWNSLPEAMIALFMLFTGNNLTDTMYAAVHACGWNMIWYFLTFIGFITLCFTNLFLGVLLDTLSLFLESEVKFQEEARESRRVGVSKQETDFALTSARKRTLRAIQ